MGLKLNLVVHLYLNHLYTSIEREASVIKDSKSEESDKEEDEIQAMTQSEALQKFDDLLLTAHNRQDGNLSKVLADAVSKVENTERTKANRIVKFFKIR